MDRSESVGAEGFPLQPYDGDSQSSLPRSVTQPTRPKRTRPTFSKSDDIELRFLRVVGRNKIPIVRPADIQLVSPSQQADSSTRNGLTMQVQRVIWNNQEVALKRIRRRYFDGGNESSTADDLRDYGQAMYDLTFELQIMSKKSLHNHRNIVKLLAVSFDTAFGTDIDSTYWMVLPTLIVELADDRFPDLSLFLNSRHNPSLPERLPFETAAALIADIADGVQALHNHDIVHADLKPQNILIFPDHDAPCGLVAKIADFGFSGMATYTNSGKRAWMPDSGPRGGTTEWNAPECIGALHINFSSQHSFARAEQPFDMPLRDIYSFGLLACYIALDGQTPKSYINNLQEVKVSDGMVNAVTARLKEHHSHTLSDDCSLGNLVGKIAGMTLHLDHNRREKCLGDIRQLLFGSDSYAKDHPKPEPFVLNFNLFPSTAHEFRCDGLYAAYWQSPMAFRRRVFESFRTLSSGPFGQYVAPEIWACLERKEDDTVSSF